MSVRSWPILGVVLGCLLPATIAMAHPMGNFSINHYSSIQVEQKKVEVLYVIDMAEIPTFQELHADSLPPSPSDPRTREYVSGLATKLKNGLSLTVDHVALPLHELSHEVIFPTGAGGLPTMKVAVRLESSMASDDASATHSLDFQDGNFPDRAGWKEIIATPRAGVKLASSSVPDKDRSGQLSNYPTDLLNSPPQTLDAKIAFNGIPITQQSADNRSDSTQSILRPNQQGTPKSAFTQLIATRQMTWWFVLTALFISAALGAFHALEPGHGKTVVAAYLVGSHGKARHAALLGLIVTATHTAGVYVLGIITLYASAYIVPERLYPWLGAASGIIIAGLGIILFIRRVEGEGEHEHHHGEGGHTHSHGMGSHSHGGGRIHSHDAASAHGQGARKLSARELTALGITGGIIPCPAALVVLLGAMAVGRVGFGLLLIVAFSVGLATALISIGMMVVFARRFLDRFKSEGPLITRWLPLASSGVITAVGIVIALRSLATTGMF